MIRIRVIYGSSFLLSRDRLEQVQEIFRQAFPSLAGYADKIPSLLRDPIEHGYRSALLVAEGAIGRVDGFALVMHFPGIESSLLDFIAVRPGIRGGGIGGTLYDAVREYCQRIGSKGLYMEVQPDVPELTPDPAKREESRTRIRFYEQYGVRVIEGTAYAAPVGDPPTVAFLLFDGLGRDEPLGRDEARQAVEMILTRRFGHVVEPEYVARVVDSFNDDPVRFRPFRYVRDKARAPAVASKRLGEAFAMVSSPKHTMHHVMERGYFERPIRVEAIQEVLGQTGLFTAVAPREHGEKCILAVHEADFVHYLRSVCSKLKEGRPVYPDTFPIRRPDRRPKELPVQAGYYCLDTGTPLYRNAYVAARAAADTALTAADEILAGRRLAYALCRPPGHHAGRRFFGGFCYFNNAAIAAQYLSVQAQVALLDVDFHHGNGTQDVFYGGSDVLTVSIHGHPDYSYPYFSGYEHETGTGDGLGFNRNFPLPPKTTDEKYLRVFHRAIDVIEQAKAEIIVVSLGFDVLKGDPTGTFLLTPAALRTMGKRLVEIGWPVLVVQEGGYSIRNIKRASAEFFTGCAGADTAAGLTTREQRKAAGPKRLGPATSAPPSRRTPRSAGRPP
ncbi:MAG TPA: histone deacetylase family protein [Thermoguttaceae bacterium]|nr:histone deacetylase family protein [Thermoguttaceae bacterium]